LYVGLPPDDSRADVFFLGLMFLIMNGIVVCLVAMIDHHCKKPFQFFSIDSVRFRSNSFDFIPFNSVLLLSSIHFIII
jgi:hypothetical protein